ncbi:hypothetical protein AL035_00520 [Salipiger aestuarii]|uniref:Uncharacterized protein n=1 Tax=Salipiger aestuarii TaxID=568098 RepID=A0A327YYE3_9RHOB|nr:hypothetical protein [Salipiger aestuarii]EIE49154.1 hypothetical protein C357_20115 [Citreicella sp. 357]KAB2543691.1 hypothetical protein AL035_00520 [Salipiger aestuarii]RAK22929.1 hypothetical protein ATI53_1002108 [Salipiger aestuarii]
MRLNPVIICLAFAAGLLVGHSTETIRELMRDEKNTEYAAMDETRLVGENQTLSRVALAALRGQDRDRVVAVLDDASLSRFDRGQDIVIAQVLDHPGQIAFGFENGRLNEIRNDCAEAKDRCAETGGSPSAD